MKTILILLAGALLAAGCATGYHSSGLSGGYSETWYAPDTVRVVFRGNEYTLPEQTQDFALLRAAELAIAHGYSYFRLTDGRTLVFFEPRTGLVIQFFKEKPANIFTYDAAFLRQSVRQKYGLK